MLVKSPLSQTLFINRLSRYALLLARCTICSLFHIVRSPGRLPDFKYVHNLSRFDGVWVDDTLALLCLLLWGLMLTYVLGTKVVSSGTIASVNSRASVEPSSSGEAMVGAGWALI